MYHKLENLSSNNNDLGYFRESTTVLDTATNVFSIPLMADRRYFIDLLTLAKASGGAEHLKRHRVNVVTDATSVVSSDLKFEVALLDMVETLEVNVLINVSVGDTGLVLEVSVQNVIGQDSAVYFYHKKLVLNDIYGP